MKQTKKLHPFMDYLKKAKRQNAEFCEWLAMAEEAFENGNAEHAYEYALRAYEKTERTTLICRMIPAYFGRPNAFQMIEDTMLEVVPVKIGFTKDGWFCMQIPALLPKKQKGSVDYIRGILYPARALLSFSQVAQSSRSAERTARQTKRILHEWSVGYSPVTIVIAYSIHAIP